MKMETNEKWLQWAVELQSIAQAGLFYGTGVFDKERYERIREIAVEMLSAQCELPKEKVKDLFCCESGYQTPKLDTRSAVFKDDKILLVKENDGTWSMPGGWVDVDLSIKENAVKEVKEESGFDVSADMIIAVQDRDRHNYPVFAYKICKIFVLCSLLGGEFVPNSETTEMGFFGLDELPEVSDSKSSREQIQMCFDAYHAENWKVIFD